jgi:fatty-acid desaturase
MEPLFFGGVIAELIRGGSAIEALQLGLSVLIWGVFVRTVLVWHITWSVNSVTHLWGYATTRLTNPAATM